MAEGLIASKFKGWTNIQNEMGKPTFRLRAAHCLEQGQSVKEFFTEQTAENTQKKAAAAGLMAMDA